MNIFVSCAHVLDECLRKDDSFETHIGDSEGMINSNILACLSNPLKSRVIANIWTEHSLPLPVLYVLQIMMLPRNRYFY
jgi:hypothetical protein